MNKFIISAQILLLLIDAAFLADPLIRKTRYGLVRGTLDRSKVNASIEFFSFIGIPYAKPPVEKLRFQEPLPPEPWKEIKEANRYAEECVQFSDDFNGPDVIGSEDCLYLNVYVPKTTSQEGTNLMPVMFWIHGGNFVFATSKNDGPDYVIEKNVVVVTIQYRLNVFGFLSTLDKYATGNFGLKDQVMALKWVEENIKSFDGDPKNVTIIGQSAGGASVQYHILSTKSRGLFQRAISHSGSVLDRWAHQNHPREMAFKLANGLGLSSKSSKEIIEELQKIDYKTVLSTAFNATIVGDRIPYYAQPFSTCIESKSDTAFISDSTYTLLEKGIFNKVPYILGYNTEEGAFAYDYVKKGEADINIYETNPELLIPSALYISKGSNCSQEVVKRIKAFYFENRPTNDMKHWINFMSFELFVHGIRKSVDFMYKHMPLYYYKFSFLGSRTNSYAGGVGHHEELLYLWYNRNLEANTKESEEDTLTRRRLVTMWTNFAATGNPTPEKNPLLQNIKWPKVTQKDEIPFLDIGLKLKVEKNSDQKDYEFWQQLFKLCKNPANTTK